MHNYEIIAWVSAALVLLTQGLVVFFNKNKWIKYAAAIALSLFAFHTVYTMLRTVTWAGLNFDMVWMLINPQKPSL